MNSQVNWRSPNGTSNAVTLRAQYASGFAAIAEYDRIGHLLLFRAASAEGANKIETLVGIAMLRRAVTVFAGVRELLEGSLPDPAKALARAYFELWLQHRCLAYGDIQPVSLETATNSADREPRARRYYVAAERRGLRARALILEPDSDYPPPSTEERDSLQRELIDEINRLRLEFPDEWAFFGDVTEATVARHVRGRDEPPWYEADFPSKSVATMAKLAAAFAERWQYEFLYDAFSALVHSRGIAQDITIEGNVLSVHHPHDSTWFQMIAYFVVGWHAMLLMTAAKWHSPEMISQLQDLHTRCRSAIESLKPTSIPGMLA